MLNIGMTELLAFGIIALLVLGPDKLPEAARFAGKTYAKIKRLISNVQNDIDRELRLSELREQMQQEMQKIQALEAKMQAQMQAIEHQKVTLIEAQNSPAALKQIAYIPCQKPMLRGPMLSKKLNHVYKVAL
jgi:sec-independent protein translocase protein TatB